MRLLLAIRDPWPEPESQRSRLLRVLARVLADQEHAELQRELRLRQRGRAVAVGRVLVDDDAGVVAAGHVLPLADAVDQLALDQDDGRVGRFAFGRHHHFFVVERRLAGGVVRMRSVLDGLHGMTAVLFGLWGRRWRWLLRVAYVCVDGCHVCAVVCLLLENVLVVVVAVGVCMLGWGEKNGEES